MASEKEKHRKGYLLEELHDLYYPLNREFEENYFRSGLNEKIVQTLKFDTIILTFFNSIHCTLKSDRVKYDIRIHCTDNYCYLYDHPLNLITNMTI